MLAKMEPQALVIKYNEEDEGYEFFAQPTKRLRDSLKRFESIYGADSDCMDSLSIAEDPFFRLFRKMDKQMKITIREGKLTPLNSKNIVFHNGQFYYEGNFSTVSE